MPRNLDFPLIPIPERSEDPCDVKTRPVPQYFSATLTEAKCEVFNERKCASVRDLRECDKAYGDGVTAIMFPDQDKFRKEVFLRGVVMFLHVGVIDVVKIVIVGYAILLIDFVNIVIVRFVNIILVGVVMFILCGVVKVILQGIVKMKDV